MAIEFGDFLARKQASPVVFTQIPVGGARADSVSNSRYEGMMYFACDWCEGSA
ncbi:hypothetical protein AB2B41_15620 [Marimonas sp. MJW-29]|uniref:Uncharacterized protein n=1 Tax=Sulfitobacter sediminis TaxID=3234186 RepID=A0ABV3RQ52_9RHOB